jgi:hypothetical protein
MLQQTIDASGPGIAGTIRVPAGSTIGTGEAHHTVNWPRCRTVSTTMVVTKGQGA